MLRCHKLWRADTRVRVKLIDENGNGPVSQPAGPGYYRSIANYDDQERAWGHWPPSSDWSCCVYGLSLWRLASGDAWEQFFSLGITSHHYNTWSHDHVTWQLRAAILHSLELVFTYLLLPRYPCRREGVEAELLRYEYPRSPRNYNAIALIINILLPAVTGFGHTLRSGKLTATTWAKTQENSSCCSTDLQGHPRSMIFISSERAYATFY